MKVSRKPRIQPKLPLASMGDIAFLLIIFFMITSVFVKEAHIEVTMPDSPDLAQMEDSQVSVTMDRDGVIWVQGNQCGLENLQAVVEHELSTRKDPTVMLKIDKNVRQDQFAPVLKKISEAGAQIAWQGKLRDLE